MNSCCSPSDVDGQACPKCGHVGLVVGVAPVRPHFPDAIDGDWQYCNNEQCEVIYHSGSQIVDAKAVTTQVGLKATNKATPVCFCFAHTAEAIVQDLAEHGGVSRIKAEIKDAVSNSECACQHLNPRGNCCLADVHRTIKRFAQPISA